MTLFSFFSRPLLLTLFTATTHVSGLKYEASEAPWNLNTNRTATNPLDYAGSRGADFKYAESPSNWRVPFYTVFLDRFVNGDPGNDNINETVYETDMMSTQLRFGGDLEGLKDSLDYIAGMGIKVFGSDQQQHGTVNVLTQVTRSFTSLGPRSSTSHGALMHIRYVEALSLRSQC
jgi:alpha-1,3-glucan synthase